MSLIDQFLKGSEIRKLVEAVMSMDSDFFKTNSGLYDLLGKPDQILENQKEK